jgi:hypothetical protein
MFINLQYSGSSMEIKEFHSVVTVTETYVNEDPIFKPCTIRTSSFLKMAGANL